MPDILKEQDLIYKDEFYKIVGCAMEVHRELGPGFLEAVYIDIYYKEKLLNKKYISDFICFKEIIVELKTVEKLKSEYYAQVLNYLKATKCKLGILINFGSSSLEYKRIIR